MEGTEIRESQDVPPPLLEPEVIIVAAFWRRVFANLFDVLFLIVTITIFLAIRGGYFLEHFTQPISSGDPTIFYQSLKHELLRSAVVIVSFVILYFVVLESWFLRGTLGKIIFSVRIASVRGGNPGFFKILLRLFAKFVLGLLTLGLSWAAVLLSKRRQAWHDRIARTVVVLSLPK